jgi:choice-of-anchor A domain-containing protein
MNMNGGGSAVLDTDGLISEMISMYQEDALSGSAYFGSLSSTANASFETIENKNLSFTLDAGTDYGIVNISASDLENSNLDQISYTLNGTGALIINVAGTEIDLTQGNFTDVSSDMASQVLWNFYEAESLSISTNFTGSILAPNAELNLSSVTITGSVVVESAVINGPISLPTFDSSLLPTVVPEVSHYALLAGLAMAGMVLCQRRHARLR